MTAHTLILILLDFGTFTLSYYLGLALTGAAFPHFLTQLTCLEVNLYINNDQAEGTLMLFLLAEGYILIAVSPV